MKLLRDVVVVPLLIALSLRGVASAQPAPPPTPAASPPSKEDANKDKARDHFQKGLSLFDEEAWDAALAEFMTSRSIFPTRSATKNAALCLHKLHRFDEAVDMFEELLRFPNVAADDKELGDRELKTLRGLVGTIDLHVSEPGAAIGIDGRDRGVAPLAAPIRVATGTHSVRVYKDGFATFETRIEVAGGQAQIVDAKLHTLAQSGRLKVTEQSGKVLDVVVDNVVVGKTPWEGALAPGNHAVILRGEGVVGTQPASVPVKLNEVTPLTLVAEDLAATLRIDPTPAGATVAIDGVNVGHGMWEGHLRVGRHKIEIGQDGFLATLETTNLTAGKREVVALELKRDPSSPLWTENRPRFVLEVNADFALAPSLGGDVAGCASPCKKAPALGFLALGRGTYQFRSGFGLGLEAGYLMLQSSISNRATVLTAVSLNDPGTAADALRLSGVLAGAAAGVHLGSKFPATFRVGAGALIGSLRDERTGSFSTSPRAGKPAESYAIGTTTESVGATYFYLTPEVRIGMKLGEHVEISAGVEAMVLIALSQPAWKPTDKPVPASIDGQGVFAADALAGKTIIAVAPGLGARYDF